PKLPPCGPGDHFFTPLLPPSPPPMGALPLCLSIGGGDGVVAGPTARAILDHIFVPQQASSAAADVPQRDSADAQ
ncbi:penicillin-binding protein 2, partial [Klebsiella pneumoniae subsp. pneumoniae]